MRPVVRDAIDKALSVDMSDPRRMYDAAISTRYSIEDERIKVAQFFGCEPSEVIFTSSSAESLAMFAYGVIDRDLQSFIDNSPLSSRANVVATPYDSKIIHETWLRENVNLRVCAGNENATFDAHQFEKLVDENTLGVSVPFAHPDTGTLQDVSGAVQVIRRANPNARIHLDARNASGYTRLNFHELDVDAMTVDCVTFGGPAGVAALILRSGLLMTPLLAGATQERGRRAGIENVIGISGFGALCEETSRTLDEDVARISDWTNQIAKALVSAGALLIGGYDLPIATNETQLPHIVSAYFPGIAASVIVAEFNRQGINIHAGSSCGSEEFEPSQELLPVTGDDTVSECVFRVSPGWATTQDDIDEFVTALANISVIQ